MINVTMMYCGFAFEKKKKKIEKNFNLMRWEKEKKRESEENNS